MALFVEFLVTKHGLADSCVPTAIASARFTRTSSTGWCLSARRCSTLQLTLAKCGPDMTPTLMRGIGNLCIGGGEDTRYDPNRLVGLVLAGLTRPTTTRQWTAGRSRRR
jgi:hypothetical protein